MRKALKDTQKAMFERLSKEKLIIITQGKTKRTADALVKMGYASQISGRKGEWIYEPTRLCLTIFEQQNSSRQKPVRAELGVIVDPPKKKIVRPPALYSNRSQQERIDYILKNY